MCVCMNDWSAGGSLVTFSFLQNKICLGDSRWRKRRCEAMVSACVFFYRLRLPPPPAPSGSLPRENLPPDRIWAHAWIWILCEFLRIFSPELPSQQGLAVTKTSIWAGVLNLSTYFVYFSLNTELLWSPENLFALSLWKSLSPLYLFWTDIKR